MEKQLLTILLELYTYNNRMETWSLKKFAGNPPRLYRLQMINALMKAFNIKCSYTDFLKGEFITEENLPSSEEILRFTAKLYPDKMGIKPQDNCDVGHAKYIFQSFIQYRLKLVELFDIGSGVYAASGYNRIPSLVFFGINKKLEAETNILDTLILLFMKFVKSNYSREDLIRRFNYPDVDLDEIDSEWM